MCSETLTWKPTKRLSVLSRKCADIALVRVQEHDEELRSGFEKASYTRTALSLCRSLWVKEADRPWQPLETGHEPDTAPTLRI